MVACAGLAGCGSSIPQQAQPQPTAAASQAGAATGAAPEAGQAAIETEPELIGCRLDRCTWSMITAQSVVRHDTRGVLVALQVRHGASRVANEDTLRGHVHWIGAPQTTYVFCSSVLPAVITQSAARPEVAVLDFAHGIAADRTAAANLFARTCYPGDTWTAPDFASRHGLAAFADKPAIALHKPEDIFAAAERIGQTSR